MSKHVALLRGINVGGSNIIKMVDLRACFEAHGYLGVRTYIQSGNVIFEADRAKKAKDLEARIESMLREHFDYEAIVVLRTEAELASVVERAPPGFGEEPSKYRYDVIFLKAPLTAKAALASVAAKEGVDRAWTGPGVLYFSRLARKASSSRLSKIVSSPIYPKITIRNWNTTSKLLALMREA